LRLHVVDLLYASGLGIELRFQFGEASFPELFVCFELTDFLLDLAEAEPELPIVFLGPFGKQFLEMLVLSFEDLFHRLGFCLATFLELLSGFGRQFLSTGFEMRKELLNVRGGGRLQITLDLGIYRLSRSGQQALLQELEGFLCFIARVGNKRGFAIARIGPAGGDGNQFFM
jgi:hypothetical protein